MMYILSYFPNKKDDCDFFKENTLTIYDVQTDVCVRHPPLHPLPVHRLAPVPPALLGAGGGEHQGGHEGGLLFSLFFFLFEGGQGDARAAAVVPTNGVWREKYYLFVCGNLEVIVAEK